MDMNGNELMPGMTGEIHPETWNGKIVKSLALMREEYVICS